MSRSKIRLIVIAAVLNLMILGGTIAGLHYFADGVTPGTASVGFQGEPENGISHLYLNVSEIDFQGGPNTTDAVYLSSSTNFDLLSLVNVTKLLGDVSIWPGHYVMIRFVVNSAVATIGGKNVTLKLPSGEVKVPLQFDVASGHVTNIVLTIYADNIQIIHNHILRPVVTGVVDGPN